MDVEVGVEGLLGIMFLALVRGKGRVLVMRYGGGGIRIGRVELGSGFLGACA